VAVLKIEASTVANSMPKRSAVASWSAIAAALAASHPAEAASEAACVADAELTMLSGALNELMSSRSRACGRADALAAAARPIGAILTPRFIRFRKVTP